MVDKGVQKTEMEVAVAPSVSGNDGGIVTRSVSHKKTSMTDFVTPLKQNSVDPKISYFDAVNEFESPTKPNQTI